MPRLKPVLDNRKFWHYSGYAVLLSVLSNGVFSLLTRMFPDNAWVMAAFTTGLLIFGFWILIQQRNRIPVVTALQVIPGTAAPSQVLIALCGPSPPDKRTTSPALEAAIHHRPALKHLWLITSHKGRETADWVNGEVAAWGVSTHPPIIVDDTCAVSLIKLEVETARRKAIEIFSTPEDEIICDFTGMQKPATAGMILACAPAGRRLQYLQGQYDAEGKLIPGAPSIPIEIEISFAIDSDF